MYVFICCDFFGAKLSVSVSLSDKLYIFLISSGGKETDTEFTDCVFDTNGVVSDEVTGTLTCTGIVVHLLAKLMHVAKVDRASGFASSDSEFTNDGGEKLTGNSGVDLVGGRFLSAFVKFTPTGVT